MSRFLRSWYAMIILGVILFFVVGALVDLQGQLTNVNAERSNLKARMAQLPSSTGKPSQDQSQESLEHDAREKLNYKMPDEHVVFVYHAGIVESPAPSESPTPKPESWFQKIWRELFGN